jgi:hypothetical protein
MLQYKKDFYSQNGEDGIIEELLMRIPTKSKWACEFGACDGKRYSNTFRLVETQEYNAVYIENDEMWKPDLVATANQFAKILPIFSLVTPSGSSSLDEILRNTPIPIDFDVLSIDIDSNDYQVWEGVQVYKPKIVVIEINSGLNPWNLTYIHGAQCEGTGFLPMVRLGERKGYTLVCHTGNCIFVRNDLISTIGFQNPGDVRTLFDKRWGSWPL